MVACLSAFLSAFLSAADLLLLAAVPVEVPSRPLFPFFHLVRLRLRIRVYF